VKKAANKPTIVPRILPRGRHKLDPKLVAASQRQRLLEAMTTLVAEKGYAAVTIGDIVRHAGTAKRTFYDHFPDKLNIFLEALDLITETLLASGRRAFATTGSVRERCEYSLRGYLALLVSMPNTAKVFYLEAAAAGPEALARRHDVQLKFVRHIVGLSRAAAAEGKGQELSDLHALGVVSAIHGLIHAQLQQNGPDSLLEIADTVVELAVAFLTVRMPPPLRRVTMRRRKPASTPPTTRRPQD
jgi:AcrR family transcriptional regulator